MTTLRFIAGMLSVAQMVLASGMVFGQATSTGSGPAYPNKPLRIVNGSIGSGNDFLSRLIAQGISAPLGQQVIVENRPSGIIPGEVVSKAAPDGYTVLLTGGSFWIGPLVLRDVPYDPVRDFLPISLTNRTPNVLVVHPSLPAKSVSEFIAFAKARPGEINYSSSSSPGGTAQLAAELFNSMAGVKLVRVPYQSGTAATADLISGQVQLTFDTPVSVMSQVKAGRLRALAVTSVHPSDLAPGLPTVSASGLPGYEVIVGYGVFAPAKTPEVIINRLNQEMVRFLNTSEAKEKAFNAGMETVASSPEQLAATMKSDIAKWSKVIKEANIR